MKITNGMRKCIKIRIHPNIFDNLQSKTFLYDIQQLRNMYWLSKMSKIDAIVGLVLLLEITVSITQFNGQMVVSVALLNILDLYPKVFTWGTKVI